MARDVDPKKTRKALRQLKRALAQAEADGVDLSEWEREFAESLEERLETFGSGFADPDKGDVDEALSALQALKIKEIAKKGKAKTRFGGGAKRSGFGARSRPRGRDIADEAERDEAGGAEEGGAEEADRGRSLDFPNRTRWSPWFR